MVGYVDATELQLDLDQKADNLLIVLYGFQTLEFDFFEMCFAVGLPLSVLRTLWPLAAPPQAGSWAACKRLWPGTDPALPIARRFAHQLSFGIETCTHGHKCRHLIKFWLSGVFSFRSCEQVGTCFQTYDHGYEHHRQIAPRGRQLAELPRFISALDQPASFLRS